MAGLPQRAPQDVAQRPLVGSAESLQRLGHLLHDLEQPPAHLTAARRDDEQPDPPVVLAAGPISAMGIGNSAGDMLGLLALALAVSATATLWSAGIAMRLRTMQAGPVMQMPIFIVIFLAPVYVPLELVAGWVHDVARFNPVTAMLEASRGFIVGEPTKVGIAAACLAVMFALAAYWARGGLRSAEAAG